MNPPLTRGCQKRKRKRNCREDILTDETASVLISRGENTTNHFVSEQDPRKNRTCSIAALLNDKASLSVTPNQFTSCVGASGFARTDSGDRIRARAIQVEHESRVASTLLRLLCFLDGASIPEFMLIRAKEPQKVWNSSGEAQKVSVTEVGLNVDVLSLVLDNVKIDEAIKRLEAAMLIVSEPGAYGYRTLNLDSATQSQLTQCMTDPLVWRLQALILVCHTFPMHSYVEPL